MSSLFSRIKLEHFLTSYTTIYSKSFKDLNIRRETIKLLKKNTHTGSKLMDIGLNNSFLDRFLQAKKTKAKIKNQDYIEINAFAQQRKP